MKKNNTKEAIEITTFKLAGYSSKQFIAANADIDEWLKRQTGFQSRRIVELDNKTIADILIWDSAEDGRSAMKRIMDEMAHSPVHAMIDQATVSWNVAPVLHQIAK